MGCCFSVDSILFTATAWEGDLVALDADSFSEIGNSADSLGNQTLSKGRVAVLVLFLVRQGTFQVDYCRILSWGWVLNGPISAMIRRITCCCLLTLPLIRPSVRTLSPPRVPVRFFPYRWTKLLSILFSLILPYRQVAESGTWSPLMLLPTARLPTQQKRCPHMSVRCSLHCYSHLCPVHLWFHHFLHCSGLWWYEKLWV